MARLALREHIDAPVDLVYRVVADVEQYPAFLTDVTTVEKRGDVVAMTLRMGLIPMALVTRARFAPPETIELEQVDGPFHSFTARWTFTPSGHGTDVAYDADYELPLFGLLLAGPA
ncbi:MAG: type II toxin-antitoxin system RatA family toxin, partial [Candidatus Rokuibacteriota bacterium]